MPAATWGSYTLQGLWHVQKDKQKKGFETQFGGDDRQHWLMHPLQRDSDVLWEACRARKVKSDLRHSEIPAVHAFQQ